MKQCGLLLEFNVLATSQDECVFLTVHFHGDFIVPPHWEIRQPPPWPDIPLSPHPILLISSTKLESYKYQFDKSLVWLDQWPNSWSHTHQGLCSTDSVIMPGWNSVVVFKEAESVMGFQDTISLHTGWLDNHVTALTLPYTYRVTFSIQIDVARISNNKQRFISGRLLICDSAHS